MVDYYLEARGGKTLLRLVHSFGTGADWEQEYYDSTSRGWRFMLANLRHYLERHPGTPRRVAWSRLRLALPPEEIWQRLMSPEGLLCHATTTDACDDAGVYVGTTGGEIFFSRNAGDSWELIRAHLPPVLSLEAAVV